MGLEQLPDPEHTPGPVTRLELVLDEDDYRDLQAEFAYIQSGIRDEHGCCLPEGDSNLPGALVGEICRKLQEYRALYDAEHP